MGDQDARPAQADLTGIQEARAHDPVHGGIEVDVVQEQRGILPSEFEAELLEHRCAGGGHEAPGCCPSREADAADHGMLDDRRPDLRPVPMQEIQDARRQTGLEGQFPEPVSREWGHLTRLGDDGVAHQQCWCDLPSQQVQRQIPW